MAKIPNEISFSIPCVICQQPLLGTATLVAETPVPKSNMVTISISDAQLDWKMFQEHMARHNLNALGVPHGSTTELE